MCDKDFKGFSLSLSLSVPLPQVFQTAWGKAELLWIIRCQYQESSIINRSIIPNLAHFSSVELNHIIKTQDVCFFGCVHLLLDVSKLEKLISVCHINVVYCVMNFFAERNSSPFKLHRNAVTNHSLVNLQFTTMQINCWKSDWMRKREWKSVCVRERQWGKEN